MFPPVYTFTQQLSEAEYLGAMTQLNGKMRRWLYRVIIPAMSLGLLFLGYSTHQRPVLLLMAAVAVFLNVVPRLIAQQLPGRRYRTNLARYHPITYTLNERGLDVVGAERQAVIGWSQISLLRETPDFLFAQTGLAAFELLRKDRLTPQALDYLRAHLPATAWQVV